MWLVASFTEKAKIFLKISFGICQISKMIYGCWLLTTWMYAVGLNTLNFVCWQTFTGIVILNELLWWLMSINIHSKNILKQSWELKNGVDTWVCSCQVGRSHKLKTKVFLSNSNWAFSLVSLINMSRTKPLQNTQVLLHCSTSVVLNAKNHANMPKCPCKTF